MAVKENRSKKLILKINANIGAHRPEILKLESIIGSSSFKPIGLYCTVHVAETILNKLAIINSF